jgi:xanthine dehydrogenase accessory factor
MKELLDDLDRWRSAGLRVAVARVVDLEGSGPREPGAAMAVAENGEVAGSVSGGCVEGAVVAEALSLLNGERLPGVVTFGYSDDEAFAVGLTCGGIIHLFLDELPAVVAQLAADLRTAQPLALATVIASDAPSISPGATLAIRPQTESLGTLGDAELDRVVTRDALGELDAARSGIRHYGPQGQSTPEDLDDTPVVRVFVESFAPPPQMWIFGAVDFTAALAKVAKVLGYRVTVCDAREVFATRRRFPMADEVLVTWPGPVFDARGTSLGSRDAVCILTHDPKFDVPAVKGALATRAGYIGVMGSRRTHATRLERLAEAGVDDPEALKRLRSPIGLDLGGRTPEETAISICAEIIAQRTGRSAAALRDTSGPLHSGSR